MRGPAIACLFGARLLRGRFPPGELALLAAIPTAHGYIEMLRIVAS
jgi:hypothetical protein